MADLDAQALAKMPREQLVSLVVNNLNLISADDADKMRDDEIVHLLRMNLDVDYQKQVSAVSQANSKKTAPKKSQPKKTKAVKEAAQQNQVEMKLDENVVKAEKVSKRKTTAPKADANDADVEGKKSVTKKPDTKKPAKTTKATKTSTKKDDVKTESSVELDTTDKSEAVSEPTEIAENSKPKKTTRSRKVGADKPVNDGKETTTDAPVAEENVATENKSKKTSSRKSKKTSQESVEAETNAANPEENVTNNSSEAEVKTKIKAKSNSKRKKNDSSSVESAESAVVSEKTSEEPAQKDVRSENSGKQNPNRNQFKKTKKHTFSFGPGVETKVEATTEVDTSTATANASGDSATPAEPQETQPAEPEIQLIPVAGVLSIGAEKNDYCGFLHANNYLPGDGDAYVSGQFIRRMGLRKGDFITGLATPARGKGNAPLKQVLTVNGIDVSAEDFDFDTIRKRKKFENLTAIYPDEKLVLETAKDDYSTRIIDIICPIGKGQRGMVVSPPKAGKTVLLKKIANAITSNNPNCKLIVLLIDERPEEVTDMQRSIKGEVVYSTFDKKPENHVRVTELVLERAMRLVEMDEDVVILLDSMTRLARAYNLTITPTGRTLSGGLDPGSLYGPKRFFGAARNIEHGGSLTIISTSLIETGSRMDEVIFEEFKGTGNMEVVLDRKLADRRVFPAIAVDKSGTRREDLLLSPEELDAVWKLRKKIADFDTVVATDLVIKLMERTPSNQVFVDTVIKKFDEMDQR